MILWTAGLHLQRKHKVRLFTRLTKFSRQNLESKMADDEEGYYEIWKQSSSNLTKPEMKNSAKITTTSDQSGS